ncbi:MAG: DUF4349 domain-containing protein [Clostridia bacterium]|nr:DUF4349 domain-containing protein [Clostridia bacterium]
MKAYKEEVDALHAPDTLKQAIAELPKAAKPKKTRTRRIAAVAAVLAVVLLGGFVLTPMMFSVQKSAQRSYESISDSASYDYAPAENGYYADDSAGYGSAKGVGFNGESAKNESTDAQKNTLPADRKLIRNAELNVETKEFDAFCDAVQKKAAELSGYVESTVTGTRYSDMRYANLVLRIPAAQLDAFLQTVSQIGAVTYENTSMRDVTDDYIDVESRLAALETEQETLLDLLKQSKSLSDTLEIQDRLTTVRGELESYKGQLKALDSKIDYSTVTMTVDEVERVTTPESKSFWTQVRQNLADNLYSIGQSARNFAISFLSNLPYIVIWLIVIGVVVTVVVLIRRKRRR